MFKRLIPCLLLPLTILSCGGGSSPSGPSTTPTPQPTPTPEPGHPVSGAVYYDENGNGQQDAGEIVTFPGIYVEIGGRVGTTEVGGTFTVADVPAGTQPVTLRADSLPSYFEAGPAPAVEVPQAAGPGLSVPVQLPIARNRPNRYMAYGDSISFGIGSGDGEGYRYKLAQDLINYWGRADISNEGVPGTKSYRGVERMGDSLNRVRPAFTLILYGTNDWNDGTCRGVGIPCYTVDSLRTMIGLARSIQSRPIVGTIPPVNPLYIDRLATERNAWVVEMNEHIREMVASENTILADIHAAFMAEPNLADLFVDHVHPSDDGYDLMADVFFAAITQPRGSMGASGFSAGPAFEPFGPWLSTPEADFDRASPWFPEGPGFSRE